MYKTLMLGICQRHPVNSVGWLASRRVSNDRNQAKTDWSLVKLSSVPISVKPSSLCQHGNQMLDDNDDDDSGGRGNGGGDMTKTTVYNNLF